MNQNFPHLSLNDNVFFCSLLLMFFPLFSLCCLSASALIKHGVVVERSLPAEQRRKALILPLRMELWHTMALPSSLPPIDSQLKALSSGSFLIGFPSSSTPTQMHMQKHTQTHVYLCSTSLCLFVYACVCHLRSCSHCLGPFEVLLRPDDSLLTFHMMQRRSH